MKLIANLSIKLNDETIFKEEYDHNYINKNSHSINNKS